MGRPPNLVLIGFTAVVAFAAGWAVHAGGSTPPSTPTGNNAPISMLVPTPGAVVPGLKGRWAQARPGSGNAAPPSRDDLEEIASLPYARGTRAAPAVERVTVHDVDAAESGLNLMLSAHAPHAQLMDMRGNTLHEWGVESGTVWPDRTDHDNPHRHFFRRARLMPDGGLLVIFEYIGLVRLDRDSKVVWAHEGRCHHDLKRTPDGRIFVLTATEHATPPQHLRNPPAFVSAQYLEDFVTILSDDGEVMKQVSILEALVRSPHGSKLLLRTPGGDLLHVNTLALLDGKLAERHPAFRAGNVLFCARNVNIVGILDLEAATVVWALQGMWSFPHEPVLLANGNLLVFDNLGNSFQSQVLEVDPITQRVVWRYRGTPEQPFVSHVCGSVQRLAGGNTLIVETMSGRAFEVAQPDDRIVWEYWNPNRAGDNGELIASLMDCVRLDPADVVTAFPEIAAAYDGSRAVDLGPLKKLLDGDRRR